MLFLFLYFTFGFTELLGFVCCLILIFEKFSATTSSNISVDPFSLPSLPSTPIISIWYCPPQSSWIFWDFIFVVVYFFPHSVFTSCFSLDNFCWFIFKFIDSFLCYVQLPNKPIESILQLWCCAFICLEFLFDCFLDVPSLC